MAGAQEVYLRGCSGFFKGLWTERRGKRIISGVQGRRYRISLRGFLASLCGVVRKNQTKCQKWKVPVTNLDILSTATYDQQPLRDSLQTQLSLLGIFFISSYLPHCPPAPAASGSWCFMAATYCSLPLCDSLPPDGPPARLKKAICRWHACPRSIYLGRSRWERSQILWYKAGLQCFRGQGLRGPKDAAASWKWVVEWNENNSNIQLTEWPRGTLVFALTLPASSE